MGSELAVLDLPKPLRAMRPGRRSGSPQASSRASFGMRGCLLFRGFSVRLLMCLKRVEKERACGGLTIQTDAAEARVEPGQRRAGERAGGLWVSGAVS